MTRSKALLVKKSVLEEEWEGGVTEYLVDLSRCSSLGQCNGQSIAGHLETTKLLRADRHAGNQADEKDRGVSS